MERLLLLIILLFPFQSLAWWETQHLLIAQVAYEYLEPNVKETVDVLCQQEAKSRDSAVRFDKTASWMDAISEAGLHTFDTWHYMIIPYNPEHIQLGHLGHKQNALWAIHKAISVLSDPQGENFEKSFMLRVLTHVTGDIHQPLHVATLFNKHFPKGVQRGHLIRLKNVRIRNQNITNLHALWDFACGAFPTMNINDDEVIKVEFPKMAKQLIEKYPIEYFQNKTLEPPRVWADESYILGIQYAYAGVKSGQTLPLSYIQRCQTICEERIALAGYRLAMVLNKIFGKNETVAEAYP